MATKGWYHLFKGKSIWPHYSLGEIDEVRIYRRVLAATEIQRIYMKQRQAGIAVGSASLYRLAGMKQPK